MAANENEVRDPGRCSRQPGSVAGCLALCRGTIVNSGAVGQPRDNNPKAAYAIYALNEGTVELRRSEYDIGAGERRAKAQLHNQSA